MHVVQQGTAPVPDTEMVWYEGTEELKAGYAICVDLAEDLTPAAGEFAELQRGRVYRKPVTANLGAATRIVVETPQKQSDTYAGWVKVINPRGANEYTAFVNGTVGLKDVLVPVNGQFYLSAQASPTAAQLIGAGGVAMQTHSGAATNQRVLGL